MKKGISRRKMLASGAAFMAACSEGTPVIENETLYETGPGREQSWHPGPDPEYAPDRTVGATPVRLAGNLRPSEDESVGDIILRIEELKALGMSSCVTGPEPWYGMSDSNLSEIRAALKNLDITVFEVGGYRNLLHTDDTLRRDNLAHIAVSIEAADKIGCPMVGTISGSRNPEGNQWGDNYAPHPDNWTLATWNMLIDGIRQILRDTAGMTAVIGMEAQVTTNIDGPVAHKRLMEDVGDPRLKVNLDPTNMMSLYTYFHSAKLIDTCFDMLGEDIFGCHAKDSYILPHQQTVHVQEVCPGRGVLDYRTYLARLSTMDWPRALLPEHIPADQYAEAYAYIRTVADEMGVTIHS